MNEIHLGILFLIAILCGYGIRCVSSMSIKEYSDMCDRWRKLHDLSMASLREAMDEMVRLEKDRNEWIARFRADKQPIIDAMLPPENPEP
jgi:hypothetical protein